MLPRHAAASKIKTCRESVRGEWVVVSPDDRQRGILASPGLQFYQAPAR